MSSATLLNGNQDPPRRCPRCGGHDLVACETKTSIWSGGEPYVIEQIPALRCDACSEVLIEDETAETLQRIGDEVLNGGMTNRKIEVPVITFPAASL